MKTDNELIAQFIANHDKTAFAQLVKRYQSSIRQFLRRMTAGDHQLADDIAQETFLLMYRKLDTFRGNAALSTWIHKIAYNCFVNQLRSHRKMEWVGEEHLVNLESTEKDLVTDLTLESLMKRLSVDERLVLTLSYSAGLSHGEIVEVTNIPLGTVKSHIKRAREKLTKLVSEPDSHKQEAVA